MKLSELLKGKTIIHVVGGVLDAELEQHLTEIAQWFVDNDITLLWGDEYMEAFNDSHPVKRLIDEIKSLGGNDPIRVLQLGEDYKWMSDPIVGDSFEIVVDQKGAEIGYYDGKENGQVLIYTNQQQDRQKAYYNMTDGLLVLNGGIGAKYEIVNAFIYRFSGDLPKDFPIMIIDNGENNYYHFMNAYAGDEGPLHDMIFENYYSSPSSFTKGNSTQK